MGWQVIDGRADQFKNFRRVMIVDVLDEFVSGPLLLAIQCREVKRMDWMAIEGGLVSFDHGVMAVYPHRPVIVRDGKGPALSPT